MFLGDAPSLSSWQAVMPLLGLIAAMAAYLSAIRIWYHKVRMDVTDAIEKRKLELKAELKKEKQTIQDESSELKRAAESAAESDTIVGYLKKRYRNAVCWLRLLAILDFVILLGAASLFRYGFAEWLPPVDNWKRSAPFNGFVITVHMVCIGLAGFSVLHVFTGVGAWAISPTYRRHTSRSIQSCCAARLGSRPSGR